MSIKTGYRYEKSAQYKKYNNKIVYSKFYCNFVLLLKRGNFRPQNSDLEQRYEEKKYCTSNFVIGHRNKEICNYNQYP